jgi:hypothetical protein
LKNRIAARVAWSESSPKTWTLSDDAGDGIEAL